MGEKPWVRSLANTCGEFEREAKSRKANAIEALGVEALCLGILWLLAYPIGVLMKVEIANTISHAALTVAALYILFVSPWIHKDTLHSWGLGNPLELWRMIRGGPPAQRFTLAVVVPVLMAALTVAFYVNWGEAADFLFSMQSETAAQIKAQAGGKALIVLLGVCLATFVVTSVIRYDNFLSALVTALKVIAVVGGFMYAMALLKMGTAAFADFHASKFGLDVLGYVCWGALQQLLFCSYFGTRLRKGFGPAKDPALRNRKRLAVAVLNGAFFGLIHVNSWILVVGTWVLGSILSWVFMEDRNRNLIALGFIHGFLGSSLGWLFSHNKAGALEVEMSVGPWHMRAFDLPTMVVVVPVVAALVAGVAYVYARPRADGQ